MNMASANPDGVTRTENRSCRALRYIEYMKKTLIPAPQEHAVLASLGCRISELPLPLLQAARFRLPARLFFLSPC